MNDFSIAVVIPVYNEADGLSETFQKLARVAKELNGTCTLVIQDDCSIDGSPQLIRQLAVTNELSINMEVNPHNLGHGPTLVRGYLRALTLSPSHILQLDGDGQFFVDDVIAVINAESRNYDLSIGVRFQRTDPWFRKLLTRILRYYLRIVAGCKSRDANSPIRCFRADPLRRLLTKVSTDAMVPNVYLTSLASCGDYRVIETVVRSRSREGTQASGSSWRASTNFLIPAKLIHFVFGAARESLPYLTKARLQGCGER